MALALELSRREGQTQQSPLKPQIHTRNPAECERPRPSPHSATQRSFSSAPFFNYGVAASSEDDEEDEDLQMALACSLSEMEAQQRAAAADVISGARGGGKAKSDKAAGSKRALNVSEKIVVREREAVLPIEVESGPDGGKKRKTSQAGLSPQSPLSSSTTSVTDIEVEAARPMENNDGKMKMKYMCGCTVC